MRRFFALILVISLWFGFGLSTAPAALAQDAFNVLTPCSKSAAFQANLDAQVATYQNRIGNFEAGSSPAKYLEGKIDSIKARYAKYGSSNLMCGDDGLPHLITDGRLDHAGEFVIPSLLFLYITGWIGWVGRAYLQAIRKESYETALAKEIVLDVPLAVKFMTTGFIWPLAALREFTTGILTAPEKDVPVSPR